MAQMSIDGEKLRGLLLRAGVKPSKASTDIGFTTNYWGKAIRTGVCSEIAAKALQAFYGIDPADYRAAEEQPALPFSAIQTELEPGPAPALHEVEAAVKASDADGLREVVREAILDAARQIAADEEIMNTLNRCFYRAVVGGIKSANRKNEGGC